MRMLATGLELFTPLHPIVCLAFRDNLESQSPIKLFCFLVRFKDLQSEWLPGSFRLLQEIANDRAADSSAAPLAHNLNFIQPQFFAAIFQCDQTYRFTF